MSGPRSRPLTLPLSWVCGTELGKLDSRAVLLQVGQAGFQSSTSSGGASWGGGSGRVFALPQASAVGKGLWLSGYCWMTQHRHPPSYCPQLPALPSLLRQFQSLPPPSAKSRCECLGTQILWASPSKTVVLPSWKLHSPAADCCEPLLQGRSALCPVETLPLVAAWQLWSTLVVLAGVLFLGLQALSLGEPSLPLAHSSLASASRDSILPTSLNVVSVLPCLKVLFLGLGTWGPGRLKSLLQSIPSWHFRVNIPQFYSNSSRFWEEMAERSSYSATTFQPLHP